MLSTLKNKTIMGHAWLKPTPVIVDMRGPNANSLYKYELSDVHEPLNCLLKKKHELKQADRRLLSSFLAQPPAACNYVFEKINDHDVHTYFRPGKSTASFQMEPEETLRRHVKLKYVKTSHMLLLTNKQHQQLEKLVQLAR